ncbi:MarR family transcriptional regulator [uncultured Sulfuricurvum sp.]|jgi:DNA-binding MarR family transcriptional regulator|uniref:MarR family winged helix-turn-helix transcriptional regulator n=1 Tax=uncultured Sulfuricurvum sp. TaxID=430693 RepID=UPI00261CE1E8|nr:MarR family transcriptional regulator [uncultured Sulfuricurvum sp.]
MEKTIQPACGNFGLLIANIKNKMRKRMNDKLKPYDITPEQRAILLILGDKGSMTQMQLCELTSMEPSNLSMTLKRLENKKYIEKTDHPEDPRAYLVRVTEKAEDIIVELAALSITARENLFEGIDERDLYIMCEALKKIDKNLKGLL